MGKAESASAVKYEFILMGIGLNDGIISKGHVCPEPEGCPKGVPSLKFDDGTVYSHDGYKKVQGPAQPLILGGRRFDTEADADKWLKGTEGKKFKKIFLNVFIARVTA